VEERQRVARLLGALESGLDPAQALGHPTPRMAEVLRAMLDEAPRDRELRELPRYQAPGGPLRGRDRKALDAPPAEGYRWLLQHPTGVRRLSFAGLGARHGQAGSSRPTAIAAFLFQKEVDHASNLRRRAPRAPSVLASS
jgi:hypothetical protein